MNITKTLTYGTPIENQTLAIASKAAKASNSSSRVPDWRARIIRATSYGASTFATAQIQLDTVLREMKSLDQNTNKESQNASSEALTEERKFANFGNGQDTIRGLIEEFTKRRVLTYSETANGLSQSYIANNKIKRDNNGLITDQGIFDLLKNLVNERKSKFENPKIEFINEFTTLVNKLENTKLEDWGKIVIGEHRDQAIDLVIKYSPAIKAALFNNPEGGLILSLDHQPVLIENIFDAKKTATKQSSKPLQELQLAALLSYVIRSSMKDEEIKMFENLGICLLDGNQLRSMSFHGIDFGKNKNLETFIKKIATFFGTPVEKNDCGSCGIARINGQGNSPELQRLAASSQQSNIRYFSN